MSTTVVRRRGAVLALLVSAWVVALGCFPIFTPEVNTRSQRLAGSTNEEVREQGTRLFLTRAEPRGDLRRYHLAVTGLLRDDEDRPRTIHFIHDEVTGQVAIVRETGEEPAPGDQAREIRLIHQPWRHDNSRQFRLRDQLLNVDGIPATVCAELTVADAHLTMQFHYRDAHDIVRVANLVVLPLPLHQHPGLAGLNRLNYVWSVPADVVVVVVGWTTFLFWGPFVL